MLFDFLFLRLSARWQSPLTHQVRQWQTVFWVFVAVRVHL